MATCNRLRQETREQLFSLPRSTEPLGPVKESLNPTNQYFRTSQHSKVRNDPRVQSCHIESAIYSAGDRIEIAKKRKLRHPERVLDPYHNVSTEYDTLT